ncbi:MAG: cupin domain-containing protein [Haloarculaceae archaeon]
MGFDKTNYEDVKPFAPGMHFLREDLHCENLGITVLDAAEGWTGKEHDHTGDGQEEVYLLLDGAGQITVDGEETSLEPGDAVRVDAESTRQLYFEEESQMVIVGAD